MGMGSQEVCRHKSMCLRIGIRDIRSHNTPVPRDCFRASPAAADVLAAVGAADGKADRKYQTVLIQLHTK